MKRTILIAFVIMFVSSIGQAQRDKSSILPTSEAKALVNQCSRESPSDFTDTWEPTKSQIQEMESKLSKIANLTAKACCVIGAKIDEPTKWYMQYVGIVRKGKKQIYISGISKNQPTEFVADVTNGTLDDRPSDMWKTHAIIICDGGTAWGVLYEPSTGKFFDLAVNGFG
jgi:hypothetical protein